MKTSVIIPTRDRGAAIVPTIESLLANDGAEFDIVVVDQSTDKTTSAAVSELLVDRQVRCIRTSSTGPGRARNIGLQVVTSDVALFTDDDCVVPADWVSAMTSLFHDPDVGMAFCNVVAAPHDLTAGFVPAYVRSRDFTARTVRDKNAARGIGAGMAVRRAAALGVSGFDEVLTASEDGDLALRLLLAGWAVHETATVGVVHHGFRTWEQGKGLAKRNLTAIGMAYAKPIRAGYWRVARVVIYEGVGLPLRQLARQLAHAWRPRGLRNLLFFWAGFARGFFLEMDRDSVTYRNQRRDDHRRQIGDDGDGSGRAAQCR